MGRCEDSSDGCGQCEGQSQDKSYVDAYAFISAVSLYAYMYSYCIFTIDIIIHATSQIMNDDRCKVIKECSTNTNSRQMPKLREMLLQPINLPQERSRISTQFH